ncbi:DUF2330 domain-containing protein [Mycobacterium intermedium]|nr:DUF2330 domain-containing protein [Mycobacterium intermedium]
MLLAPTGHACACGAAIPPSGADATMNSEVALLHWDGTTETIVMQLGMDASTDNVALVVPTPTPATVDKADQAVFTELSRLTAPKVEHQRRWRLGLGLSSATDTDAAVAAKGPQVLSQVQLGPLEATTLAGGDLAGLQKWLSDNGYAIRPAVLSALDPYVRDGWAFVAMRLTSTTHIVGGLDPVRLTFRSPRLVYPMRLSVAAQGPQRVTIFTLSDHRQQRTDADVAHQHTQVQFAGNITDDIRDPLLRELAGNHGGYLTKTQVDIDQTSRISSDFTFDNAAGDESYRQVQIVYDDATIPLQLLVPAVLVFLVIVGLSGFFLVRRRTRRTR